VVLVIIAIVAAMMFPVFANAKEGSRKATCLSNMHQVSSAAMLYSTDYDDFFMPVNHQPAETPTSRNDRTWVQLTLPYARHFGIYFCPSDTSDRPRPEASFDEDLVPGDTDTQYYTASQRTNLGYNFQYLAPIIKRGTQWVSTPKSVTMVARPSDTILFADSVWARKDDGSPTGGGSWLVVPPCRYEVPATGDGASVLDTFTGVIGRQAEIFTPSLGWRVNDDGSPKIYGGAWPWHFNRINVAMTDGSVRSMTTDDLGSGCDVQTGWNGLIRDPSQYHWDIR